MQQQAALAYRQVAKQTVSPRNREADLLSRAAGQLQRVRDDWEANRADLSTALKFNRKLWTILVTSVTKEENPLPTPIKQNVANLGIFVLGRTVEMQLTPSPEKLDSIIRINRELATGLRANANDE